ncbi:MAG: hypothetical protein AAF125_03025 [Chloroflexota bacterium]
MAEAQDDIGDLSRRRHSSGLFELAVVLHEAITAIRCNDPQAAIRHIDANMNQHFGNPYFIFYRARALDMLGDCAAASKDYRQASTTGERLRFHDPHYRLAVLARQQGELMDAAEHIGDAIEIAGPIPDYALFVAWLRYDMGNLPRAVRILDSALEKEPLHPGLRELRERLLVEQYRC